MENSGNEALAFNYFQQSSLLHIGIKGVRVGDSI